MWTSVPDTGLVYFINFHQPQAYFNDDLHASIQCRFQ